MGFANFISMQPRNERGGTVCLLTADEILKRISRRMHFHCLSRGYVSTKKNRHNSGWESGVLEFNFVRNYIRPDRRSACLLSRELS